MRSGRRGGCGNDRAALCALQLVLLCCGSTEQRRAERRRGEVRGARRTAGRPPQSHQLSGVALSSAQLSSQATHSSEHSHPTTPPLSTRAPHSSQSSRQLRPLPLTPAGFSLPPSPSVSSSFLPPFFRHRRMIRPLAARRWLSTAKAAVPSMSAAPPSSSSSSASPFSSSSPSSSSPRSAAGEGSYDYPAQPPRFVWREELPQLAGLGVFGLFVVFAVLGSPSTSERGHKKRDQH